MVFVMHVVDAIKDKVYKWELIKKVECMLYLVPQIMLIM